MYQPLTSHNFCWNIYFFNKRGLVVTKKRGCKTKQNTDRLCESKRPCICWFASQRHNLWSFPLYFPTDSSCAHSMIKNKHFFYSYKSAEQNSHQPTLAFYIHKNHQEYKLLHSRMFHQRSYYHWGLSFHTCIQSAWPSCWRNGEF
jgi:hypothetical protein